MSTCLWITGPSAPTVAAILCGERPELIPFDFKQVRENLYPGLASSKVDQWTHLRIVAALARAAIQGGGEVVVSCEKPLPVDQTVHAKQLIEDAAGEFMHVDTDRLRHGRHREPGTAAIHFDPTQHKPRDVARLLLTSGRLFSRYPAKLLVGRWQPFSNDHRRLIESLLKEGHRVALGVQTTEISEENPNAAHDRVSTLRKVFRGQAVTVFALPAVESSITDPTL